MQTPDSPNPPPLPRDSWRGSLRREPLAATSPERPDGGAGPIVAVVEDDAGLRDAVLAIAERAGYRARGYTSAEDYLADAPPAEGCLVLDYSLPGMTGLELLTRLAKSTDPPAVVVLSGRVDVRSAVRFMEGGVVRLLEKPCDFDELAEAIRAAVAEDRSARAQRRRVRAIFSCVGALSERERVVIDGIAGGQLNKSIAKALAVSVRTIESDRARILKKFDADTLGQALAKYAQYRLLDELGWRIDGPQRPGRRENRASRGVGVAVDPPSQSA